MRTAACTAQSLGMQHNGKPVQEIDFSGNSFYTIVYADGETSTVFSPDDEQPITVAHQHAPLTTQRDIAWTSQNGSTPQRSQRSSAQI